MLCFLMGTMETAITAIVLLAARSIHLLFRMAPFRLQQQGSRTNFYIDGKFVGDADRREQSTVKFIGNSSSNELFAEYLDDVRIYGVSLSFSETAAIYGGGFGDQYPSVLLRENSSRDSDPRSVRILIGKDSLPVAVTGFEISDLDLEDGTVLEMNQTADGNYSLSLDLNDSFTGSVFSLDENVSVDNDGKPNEGFREEIYYHEIVYDEAHLVSRWAFDEANGSRIRDLGIAVNDGYLVGNSALVSGKFGNALSMDGSGDYMSVPRFSGIHKDGNFTISAWVQPTNLGYNSDAQDAAIFGTDGNSADTVLIWYDVNGVSTANRTFTLNIGSTSIGLNRLMVPFLHCRIAGRCGGCMSGQGRKIYHNGLLAEMLLARTILLRSKGIMSVLVPGAEAAIWILRDYWMRSDSTTAPLLIMIFLFYMVQVTEILG